MLATACGDEQATMKGAPVGSGLGRID